MAERSLLAASKSSSEDFCNVACPSSPIRYMNLPDSLLGHPVPKAIAGAHPILTLTADDVACEFPREVNELPTILVQTGLMVYVLIPCPPKGVEVKSVFSANGKCGGRELARRARNILVRAPVPPPPARTCMGGAAPPGGHRRASCRLYSVRTPPRGWLGPARGKFLAPNSPLGPPPVPHADFLATGRARSPLGFVRWVVPKAGGAWHAL
jgi:hypothetical protein